MLSSVGFRPLECPREKGLTGELSPDKEPEGHAAPLDHRAVGIGLRQPVPLVERQCIAGVIERVDMNGKVLIALLPEEAERAVRALLSQKVDAIAVCLLWSFLNPAHELLLAETVRSLAPDVPVSLSTHLAPKMRENARCNTVVIDAFVGGVVKGYLGELQKRLAEQGLRQSVASMQCFGGVTEAQYASPVNTIGSGPVGGVMGSKYLAQLLGESNVITTDVGGTTFDVSVIWRGEEIIAREFFGAAGVMSRFEVLTPRVDIQSIGAGGGTIAWFDSASRSIKFGPESAGSKPGPVFYGSGGARVTMADAWLTLGYLDPDCFLGGRLKVHVDAAKAAIEVQLGRPLGMSVTEAALAVVELANHHMSDAIKVYLGARGFDVSDFVLFAFGGGGPMHAAAYGEISGVKRTVLVANAEVFSALGVALADTKHKQQVTLLAREPFELAHGLLHAPQVGAVGPFGDLVDLAQTEGAHRAARLRLLADGAAHQGDLECLGFGHGRCLRQEPGLAARPSSAVR